MHVRSSSGEVACVDGRSVVATALLVLREDDEDANKDIEEVEEEVHRVPVHTAEYDSTCTTYVSH
jgi:hypothetical protein